MLRTHKKQLQGEEERESDRDGDGEDDGSCSQDVKTPHPHPTATAAAKKKKKRKKSRPQPKELAAEQDGGGVEEVEAALKEVNELLGEATAVGKVPSGATATTVQRSLLCVERR